MTWNMTPHSYQPRGPIDNDDEPLLVVPNERGGFSLRFADSVTLIGHYATSAEAEEYAKTQCRNVRVIPHSPRIRSITTPCGLTKAISLIRQS